MDLDPFTCTIRVFDPATGETNAGHALPVDCPDAEHAASTIADAASFTPKTDGDAIRSVASACVSVEARR